MFKQYGVACETHRGEQTKDYHDPFRNDILCEVQAFVSCCRVFDYGREREVLTHGPSFIVVAYKG